MYSNSNVATFLTTYTGNISANYYSGNGSQLTGLPASYSDSNVVTLLSGFGSNTVSTTGNITGGNLLTSGLISAAGNITGGNITGSNVISATTLSATGNITGGNVTTAGTMTAGTIVETSSILLKENIRPLSEIDILDTVVQLAGQIYDRRDGSQQDEPGLIAEDVYTIIPNLVGLDSDGHPASVKYSRLSVYLLEAIKRLKQEIEELKRDKGV